MIVYDEIKGNLQELIEEIDERLRQSFVMDFHISSETGKLVFFDQPDPFDDENKQMNTKTSKWNRLQMIRHFDKYFVIKCESEWFRISPVNDRFQIYQKGIEKNYLYIFGTAEKEIERYFVIKEDLENNNKVADEKTNDEIYENYQIQLCRT